MISFFAAIISQQPFLGIVGDLELLDQLHRRFVGAAVKRTAQRADGAGDRGIKIRQRRR